MATPPSNDRHSALAARGTLTTQIGTFPNAYDPSLHLARARIHLGLDYPDLAAGDAYRAMLLTDYVRMFLEQGDLQPGPVDSRPDNSNAEGEEYDDEQGEGEDEGGGEDGSENREERADADELRAATHAQRFITSSGRSLAATERAALALLVDALGRVGCRAEAANYARLALGRRDDNLFATALEAAVAVQGDDGGGHGGPTARRVVYPWNTYEPDRFSAETVRHLNEHVVPRASSASGSSSSSSSSVEVRVVQLPLLGPTAKPLGTTAHLGVFATRDILAGELCLREESALTVVTDPSDGDLCEYCGQRWRAGHGEPAAETLSCERCAEAEAAGIETIVPMWCSAHCRDAAMAQYHPALCARPVAALYRAAHGPPARRLALAAAAQPGARVYALLLLKSFAMALVQHTHPLELAETKYLYGVPPPPSPSPSSLSGGADLRIGWGWEENVRGPVAILEALGIDVFTGRPSASSSSSLSARGGAPLPGPDWWDTWVVNTLLAKFRGVASGRLDARGHTEAAAAHTIYSLVNHDCRPNVRWECAGIMKFWGVADAGAGDGPGPLVAVRRGQELKSCYCDASLGYRQRREWMMGCLGGCCMCDRCLCEEQADALSGACE